jgi:phosphoribosylaminoimidazolecarboxamide formyltransferase/IMP cyclohydrolase
VTRRALLSVFDKTGVVEFARGLVRRGFALLSSGGTCRALREGGLTVTEVAEYTGSPEMMGGRVKTLHPKVHGGILARRADQGDVAALHQHGIDPIDVVAVNLYPFRQTLTKLGVTRDEIVEHIDIGGPAMVRSAAKNHASVCVVVDPLDYATVLAALDENDGAVPAELRLRLAHKAFAHTAAYDVAIAAWFDRERAAQIDEPLFGPAFALAGERVASLRYGENPHQAGARYRLAGAESWWDTAVQHGGKEMSYLNVYDTEAAWRLVHRFTQPACVIVKHANPCGVAVAVDIEAAYQRAHACDPVSAFGGIVAANRPVTVAMAEALAPVFTEVVVAPSFEPAALDVFAKKPNLRTLSGSAPLDGGLDIRAIDGGLLVQQRDSVVIDRTQWRVVTSAQPDAAQWADLEFAWTVCAAVSSNAIVYAKDLQAYGIGAGQQNRLDSARIAAERSAGRAATGVCASDAFFPFRDGLDAAAAAGIRAVIQPGGSVRDDEVVTAANEHGMAMVFTGRRHFRH